MLRAIPAILSVAIAIFALADCIQTEDDKVRGLPKWAWIVLIVLIPGIGPITWLLVGKDRTGGTGRRAGRGAPQRGGPLAPDEDPEFLRKLDEDIRRERREKERLRREREAQESAGGTAPDQPGTSAPSPETEGPDDPQHH
ncbi:PLD nuclease N-terminal domain-containing protein [Brachybacterium muris]|uniref:PLD nuclease N-terminal domain-containing protein n=1 Tax=Brachybacterium muris TaxID=219301 RepID=UPI00223C13D0|nr:PLD nuclease N-terminal domain-containing protein [Brachybacterium muris]MCT2261146.1 PLD nuclease N-terminal domain-containing protein [Brachybacterium muris]